MGWGEGDGHSGRVIQATALPVRKREREREVDGGEGGGRERREDWW